MSHQMLRGTHEHLLKVARPPTGTFTIEQKRSVLIPDYEKQRCTHGEQEQKLTMKVNLKQYKFVSIQKTCFCYSRQRKGVCQKGSSSSVLGGYQTPL